MCQNCKNDLGTVLGLILGRGEKCQLNCTPECRSRSPNLFLNPILNSKCLLNCTPGLVEVDLGPRGLPDGGGREGGRVEEEGEVLGLGEPPRHGLAAEPVRLAGAVVEGPQPLELGFAGLWGEGENLIS